MYASRCILLLSERVVGSENRLAMAAGSVLLWEIREGAGRRTGERDGESKRKMR